MAIESTIRIEASDTGLLQQAAGLDSRPGKAAAKDCTIFKCLKTPLNHFNIGVDWHPTIFNFTYYISYSYPPKFPWRLGVYDNKKTSIVLLNLNVAKKAKWLGT
jgi:hypothetical protein